MLPPHRGKEASLLWLTPHTGRRHQLRLHMAHIGHPIVGDVTYGADRRSYRMFMHAVALELPSAGLLGQGRAGADGGTDGGADSGGSGCADDAWVRGVAPLAPRGWHNAFTPSEPLRSPAGWPGAVGGELLGSSSSQGALKGIRAAER